MEYIHGEKFRSLANNDKIFYCNTHDVNSFFTNEAPSHNFILISHNSDGGVCENTERWCDANFSLAPPNLIKWFGQNIKHTHHILQSLPIGLENSEWFVSTRKAEKIKNISSTPKNIKNLVYLNLNIKTNPSERSKIYSILDDKNYVTVHHGENGMDFDGYLNNLHNHLFMVCPPGNGIDVHQPWEALYTGTIPIKRISVNTSYYRDLPICFVNEWEQLEDVNFLEAEYGRIISKEWNLEKLDFNYWKRLILDAESKL